MTLLAPPRAPVRAPARVVLWLALVTLVTAVAFVLAPVRQPDVTYTWTPAAGPAVALPLMPYQPVRLTATATCAAARQLRLTTVPVQPDPAAAPLAGLVLTGTATGLAVTSAGTDLGVAALPPGTCTVRVESDVTATTVSVDDAPVLVHPGDVRPDVAGIFSEAGTGVALALTADTRFATTPTPLKLALAALCLLAAAGLLVALAAADRAAGTRRLRLLPPDWWRPRPVDGAVGALLALWWVVGSGTVDDGYLAGIVRSRAANGYVGNVYRWLNAPEAPFSWFAEVYRAWAAVSVSTPWLRLPSTLLGLLLWALVSRLLLPRLGVGRAPWVAALAFATWWVPFGLGLRPEPWVAIGVVLVVLLVERTLATRGLVPLAAALILAGATAALTPGGLMAFAPLLAAAAPLRARLRGRLPDAALLAVLLAAPATALLLMAADQGAAALAEAVRVRDLVGGARPWHEEAARYALLVTPGDIRGAVGRRAAVLVTALAAAGLAATAPRGPTRRLLATLALSAVALMLTPTKWTQHFGALAGIGTAVLAVGLVRWGRRWWTAAFTAATLVAGQVLGGQDMWPFVSGWYTPTFSTLPPQVAGVPIATLVVAAGGVLVVAVRVWGRPARPPTPAALLAAVLVGALVLQVGGLVRVAVAHPDGYTPTADAVATAAGDPCGLESDLLVEPDPAAGVLPPAGPGWAALDARQRAGALPVVVTVVGAAAAVEFARGGRVLAHVPVAGSVVPVDRRLLAPPDADAVRLVATSATVASPPRAPVLVPMTQLLPRGTAAVLDWPVAAVFPCLTPAPLPPGTATLPRWRVGPPSDDASADITYTPGLGGPFASARLLVTEHRLPTYVRGDLTRDVPQLYRWDPLTPLRTLAPRVRTRTVFSPVTATHLRVPRLDPQG